MMQGCRGTSVSIVTEPAYSEAQFQWQVIAASFGKIKRKIMEGDEKPEIQATLTPGVVINIVDKGMATSLTTTTLAPGTYAFFFNQRGLMGGLSLQGSKITRIRP